jgi:hypothetical protein
VRTSNEDSVSKKAENEIVDYGVKDKEETFDETIQLFNDSVRDMVSSRAAAKGFYTLENDTRRQLHDTTEGLFGGHAFGEILYKMVEYKRTKDPKCLIKIAAWALMEFDRDRRNA